MSGRSRPEDLRYAGPIACVTDRVGGRNSARWDNEATRAKLIMVGAGPAWVPCPNRARYRGEGRIGQGPPIGGPDLDLLLQRIDNVGEIDLMQITGRCLTHQG